MQYTEINIGDELYNMQLYRYHSKKPPILPGMRGTVTAVSLTGTTITMQLPGYSKPINGFKPENLTRKNW